MTIEAPVITVFFGLTSSGDEFFVLDDDTRGELDNTTYLLAGDVGTDVSGDAWAVRIRRGRSRDLDEIPTGTCTVEFHNYARKFDPTYTAGPYYGNLRPGKAIEVSIYGVKIFAGVVDDWGQWYESSRRSTAHVEAVDALGRLARREFDAWTATSGQAAGARLNAILDRSEVGWGAARDLDTGISTLQGDSVTWGSNVLNYMQLVVKSDLGRLFASRRGLVTFRDRHSVITAAIAASFADDGTGIPFTDVRPRTSSELFANRVSVDREGGVAQTSTDTAAGENDDIRSLFIAGLLLDSDSQSADMADYLLNLYKEPDDRIASLSIAVSALDPADQAIVSRIDIGDVVNVVWTPNDVGDPINADLVVEGVEHTLGVGQIHVMTLALSKTTQRLTFQLDDSVLGVLDAGVLAF